MTNKPQISMNKTNPYHNQPQEKWAEITKQLVDKHPLKDELVDVVLQSWQDIFNSSIGGFKIGKDIFPEPQILGFFLHDLIALHLSKLHPDIYKLGEAKTEKDIHHLSDSTLSIEIKTSSNPSQIFANRSYAQPPTGNEKKEKDGYFLAVNFEKVSEDNKTPQILLIRFGFLEHSDWKAQVAATGQQAHLSADTYKKKFVTLYRAGETVSDETEDIAPSEPNGNVSKQV